MTFEEIREMVNSTITENGQRQITGKALNLAFVETLNAVQQYLEENKPEGGTGAELVYLPSIAAGEMNAEQQAHNAEVYAKFKTAYEEGKPMPALLIDASIMLEEIEIQSGAPAMAKGYMACTLAIYVSEESPLAAQSGYGVMLTMELMGEQMQGMLTADGSVMLMM